jgi:hypothetical protein
LAKLVRGALMALAGAFLFHAVPASADIEIKAGCDGKWVSREGSGFETYMVCERAAAPARPKLAAMRMRAHHKAVAHVRPRRVAPAPVRVAFHEAPRPRPMVVATVLPPRREAECVNLLCPQFVMVGIGY